MTTDARSISSLVASRSSAIHGQMSVSSRRPTTHPILDRSRSNLFSDIRGGTEPFSILDTRFLPTPARPTTRSLARGGQVAILSTGKTPGWVFRISRPTLVKHLVQTMAWQTSVVTLERCSWNANGAFSKNHRLNASTDRAMSFFQRYGLSRLAGTAEP